MSRCFPFPPPGYEKKARIDDADLLKKEKHREKKHKKEKKDKEKKEGKEKREKDRSDSKHRDKKDRKEKHRDKKEKEKDKDKDDVKNHTSVDKKLAGQSETSNGEKLGQKEKDPDIGSSSISKEKRLVQIGENHDRKSLLPEGAGDYKFVQELGRRIRDEEGTGSQMVQRSDGGEQRSDKQNQRADNLFGKDTGTLSEGKGKNGAKRFDYRKIDGQGNRGDTRSSGNAAAQNHAGMAQNSMGGMARPVEKIIPSGNAAAQNHSGMAQNSMGGMARPVEKIIPSGNAVVQNHVGTSQNRVARPVEKVIDSRLSGNVQNLPGMAQNSIGGMAKPPEKNVSSGSAGVQNLFGTSQIRGEGVARPMEKKVETRMEEKEKSKEKEGDEKRGDKRKGKDREKKSHGKDKEREKDKKKDKDKKKEKGEHKSKDPDKSKEKNKNNLPDPSGVRTSDVSKNGDRNNAAEENLNKRKHSETNGFLHDTDARPNKVPRPTPHPSTENGRKLEPSASINQFTSEKRGPSLNVDNKEHKLNGLIEAQSLPVSSSKTSVTTQADRTLQASRLKPPHPDSKYPSQVLSTPKMEELSGFHNKEHKVNLQASRKPPHPDSKYPSLVLSTPKMEELSGSHNKEHKVNGLIVEAQSLPVSSSKTSASTPADRTTLQASRRPPHPDSKYLSQVLSIPKMEEWSEFDDQEWLFCSKRSSGKSDARSAMVIDSPRVWAEAMQIESADVCALPYVIPF